jgi:glyoxalase family protein
MTRPIAGIHHVTAIASDPQRNLDFYTEVLGLRLVKRTINFDDPGTYHFYFGDETGQPGTILTFFPWPRARRGSAGAGEASITSFSAPPDSLDYWEHRLLDAGLPAERTGHRFDEEVLTFTDPDGMRLEIVSHVHNSGIEPWRDAMVPLEYALRGLFGVTLVQRELAPTAEVLTAMGFRKIAEEGNRHRFIAEGGAPGSHVDVLVSPQAPFARLGAGSVHHVAFRMADDESQLEWRKVLSKQHLDLTPVIDRMYFHSVYFREPGGVLFELATDPPGFAWDEPVETLGESLKLPEWLEPRRDRIEQILPPIELRKQAKVRG